MPLNDIYLSAPESSLRESEPGEQEIIAEEREKGQELEQKKEHREEQKEEQKEANKEANKEAHKLKGLYEEKQQEESQQKAGQQEERLPEAADQQAVMLEVPYIHQVRDTGFKNQWTGFADFDGAWACGAASAVMIAAYYDRLGSQYQDYGKYVSRSYQNAEGYSFELVTDLSHLHPGRVGAGAWGYIHRGSGEDRVWTADGLARALRVVDYFNKHNLDTEFIGRYKYADQNREPAEEDIRQALAEGSPVWASTELPGYGHIVVIVGYESDGSFIIHDPALTSEVRVSWEDFGGHPGFSHHNQGPKWIIIPSP